MNFDSTAYGPVVAGILALDGHGERLMPLASGHCSSAEALYQLQTVRPEVLFPNCRAGRAALAGLFLYFSCRDESHEICQTIETPDGSYWHGIVHRQEPDPDNARYWFRKVPSHPIFPDLAKEAAAIETRFPNVGMSLRGLWNPIQFVEICERARRQPGSPLEQMALEMQRAEWQLLFDSCARERSGSL